MGYAKDLTSRGSKFEPCENFFLFILSFLFSSFSFAFFWFGSLMFCLSLCLLFFFSYGHSKQTRSLLLLDLYYSAWCAICDSYHWFYPRQENSFHWFYPRLENLFHVTDCRSEGVVPANTLKRLVRRRKYINIFS